MTIAREGRPSGAESGKSRAELRKFGITVGLAFGVLATIALWRGRTSPAAVMGTIGGLLLLGGVAFPAALGPVERAWMGLAHALSKVTTPVFLGIVYFVVLTPVGLVRRTLGRNPLKHDAVDGSYWHDRQGETASDLERQF